MSFERLVLMARAVDRWLVLGRCCCFAIRVSMFKSRKVRVALRSVLLRGFVGFRVSHLLYKGGIALLFKGSGVCMLVSLYPRILVSSWPSLYAREAFLLDVFVV